MQTLGHVIDNTTLRHNYIETDCKKNYSRNFHPYELGTIGLETVDNVSIRFHFVDLLFQLF